ncbi:tetratricopeptide repeat protein [Nonomuraea sp. NPDC050547]|uniref:tetratricopeptide repeat protein n=1 Tax=unclassified Nonomuraea TaxID=2593643 RepID=UPI0037902DFD
MNEPTGPRSAALGGANSGIIITGDGAQLGASALPLPRPGDVPAPRGLSNLTKPPALDFVGRADALAALGTALNGAASVVVSQVVYGLGGVGKSELALQHATANREHYRVIWWITAESPEQIEAGLAQLTRFLVPEHPVEVPTRQAAVWAKTWLLEHDGWLLVLDNVHNPAQVRDLLAQMRGHIIVTTRRDLGARAWRVRELIALDVLSLESATDLLMLSAADGKDREPAARLAAALGCLPLAIEQAGAYIEETHGDITAYLTKLDETFDLYAPVAHRGDPEQTISKIWRISMREVGQTSPTALALLRALSCFAPDDIPLTLFDEAALGDLALLASYSLVKRSAGGVAIHRLVQSAVRAEARDAHLLDAAARDALSMLLTRLPERRAFALDEWPEGLSLHPHAVAVASLMPVHKPSISLGRLLRDTSRLLNLHARFKEAFPLAERALTLAEDRFGPDHPALIGFLTNLAATLSGLRRDDALRHAARAVAIAEASLGPGHRDLAPRVGNLAAVYIDLDRAHDALPMARRALSIATATLPPGHPDLGRHLGNLAAALAGVGDHEQALALELQALDLTERALPADHPELVVRLGNLALAHHATGDTQQAIGCAAHAVTLAVRILGPRHPTTGWAQHLSRHLVSHHP